MKQYKIQSIHNQIIAEMTLRRMRNDNQYKYTKYTYYIVLALVVGAFMLLLSHNDTAINNLINK